MKSGENCSRDFRTEVVERFYYFIHVDSPEARADDPQNFDGR